MEKNGYERKKFFDKKSFCRLPLGFDQLIKKHKGSHKMFLKQFHSWPLKICMKNRGAKKKQEKISTKEKNFAGLENITNSFQTGNLSKSNRRIAFLPK